MPAMASVRVGVARGSTPHILCLSAPSTNQTVRYAFNAPQPKHHNLGCMFSCASKTFRTIGKSPSLSVVTRAVASKDASKRPQSAREAVEAGLFAFKTDKDYATAVRLFTMAMEMKPTNDEAVAALYNLGCAHSKLKQWVPATEAITAAVNDYGLKLAVAMKDDDLKELRERREWVDAATNMVGGLSEGAKVELRSEAKAPFRLPRFFLFGALGLGGAIGLLVTISQLIGGYKAGKTTEELSTYIQNFGVNAAVLAASAFLIQRDRQSKQRSLAVTGREETLSRLQVDLGNGRQMPLGKFRGKLRPVILAGSRQFVEQAMREAQPMQAQLRNRGVSVIPVVLDKSAGASSSSGPDPSDPEAKIRALKRELAKQSDGSNKGFGGASSSSAAAPEASSSGAAPASDEYVVTDADKKWRLEAYDKDEWIDWVQAQRQAVGAPDGRRDCFIQIQLDGTVRSSGLGMPPWNQFLDDLPELSSIRTTLMDGIGPSM